MSWTPGPFDPDPGAFLNIASGVLLVGLAVFVASVKPRRRANLAFAGFAAGWGLSVIVDWIFDPGRGVLAAGPGSALDLATEFAILVLFGASMTCLCLVAIMFPRHPTKPERRFVRWAAVGAGVLGIVAVSLWAAADMWLYRTMAEPGHPFPAELALMGLDLLQVGGRFAVFLFALLVLVLRAGLAHKEGRDVERQQYVLMTVALVLHTAALNGIWVSVMDIRVYPGSVLVPAFAGLCVVAALWLSHIRLGPPPAAHAARNVAFLILGMPVVAWILFTLSKTYVVRDGSPGLAGVTGTIAVLVLAYAILRHQLLGTDVKLRWTISRGTVAAAFITVFFIASEGAQILFGADNEWLGLVAAGGLVFAIAPLQRAAERLAEKAVPSPQGPDVSGRPREERYRAAVRLAVADRSVSRHEERVLTLLALDLGIAADKAYAILDEETKKPLKDIPSAEASP